MLATQALKVQPITQVDKQLDHFLQQFHAEFSINSKHTADAYLSDVTQFFTLVAPLGLNTPIHTVPNIINYKSVVEFRQYEIDRGLQPSTINRKITAIREFARHLSVYDIHVDIGFFNNLKNLKGSGDSYEVLTIPEAITIAEWFRDNEKFHAYGKFLYTLLAIDTGVRAEALARLTPESFTELDNEVLIKGIDKGNKRFSKKISKEFYQEIKDNLDFTPKTKLFNFSAKNRTDMMNRALKALGWENRNIVFHSFKKAAVNNAFDITGDIMVAMKTGGHASVNTTQRYISEGETLMGAISNANGKEVQALDYNDYTKEELIEAVEQLSANLQYQLKIQLLNNK